MRLGVDFGTSSTVAVIALADREPRPLLFDGSPLLPSAVCLDATGRLVVGRDAVHLAAAVPGSFEPHPKRCVDDGTVLLGGREVSVRDLFAAVLDRVVEEATTVTGTMGLPPDRVVVTCPAAWGAERRAVLLAAAPPGTRLVPEPVAAAHYFVDIAGVELSLGETALVYDFGAGTFDATVVRRAGEREFEVLATRGLPDAGGLDIDAAIVAHIVDSLPDDERRQRLETPELSGDRRARQQLWDNVRTGKEMLSRATSTLVHVPLFDVDAPFGREELDVLAAPVLERTAGAVREALDVAGAVPAAIFLAGGSSRMPAVSSVLHRAFGVAPSMVDQPELAVAEGSLHAADPAAGTWAFSSVPAVSTVAAAPPSTVDIVAAVEDAAAASWPALAAIEVAPAVGSGRPWSRGRRVGAFALAGALVVALGTVGVAWAVHPKKNAANHGSDRVVADTSRAASGSPTPRPSPSPSYPPGIDPCLIGTWKTVQARTYGILDGDRVQYVGGAGELDRYNADGTFVSDSSARQPRTVMHRGVLWSDVVRGQSGGRWVAENGELTTTSTWSNATDVLTRNGKYNAGGPLTYYLEPAKYTCTATSLLTVSMQGNWSSEQTRQ